MADEIVTKKIDKISFGMLSPSTIRKLATVTITNPELYDADGYPVEKGLMDLSMGVIDPGLRCKVCGGRLRTCPGHFGAIQLARPVIHIHYVSLVQDILKTFCNTCGRILLAPEKLQDCKDRLGRLKKEGNIDALRIAQRQIVSAIKKNRKCPFCKAKQPEIKLEKPSTFYDGEKRLWPAEIRERLEKIPDEDLMVLGYDPVATRPEWMVVTTLLVPPIVTRPSITLMTGERSEDDLTHKLSDIVRVNQRLTENINAGAPEVIVEDLWDLLQYHVTTYFDNGIAQVPPARLKTNRPLRTLAQRIKGKEGRFRYNLAGKRVNFCARSVISPDPRMSIDEVGVPLGIARELTAPEPVTEWNLEWLKQLIRNGDIYPGANYVITEDGKRKKITADTKEQILEELKAGWLVERHLLDGDIVLFNRQPSLHRLSLMAHRVKLVSSRTFRINPYVCRPYGADFDGDEMNLHVPQTEEAKSEAKHLMLINSQIITPRYGLSIMGVVEDVLVGLFKLTDKDVFFDRQQFSDLLCKSGVAYELPKPDKKEGGAEYWSGRQLFSMLLPEDMNYDDAEIKIENGRLLKGTIVEKHICHEGGALIHYIVQNYGGERAKEFINALGRLGLAIMDALPFTFSIGDIDIPKKHREEIRQIAAVGEKNARKILRQYRRGEIAPIPGKTTRETSEAMILHALNKARNEAGVLAEKGANPEGNFFLAVKSGLAKVLNLGQMAGFAGQQALRGERIKVGYSKRTLAHFKRGERSAASRGFVKHSYGEGLSPIELFFNAMVGRDSYIDKYARTPKSGYTQRRLINALQDLKVYYDGTVRDSGHRIIQFRFSGDGIDVSKSDNGGISINGGA